VCRNGHSCFRTLPDLVRALVDAPLIQNDTFEHVSLTVCTVKQLLLQNTNCVLKYFGVGLQHEFLCKLSLSLIFIIINLYHVLIDVAPPSVLHFH